MDTQTRKTSNLALTAGLIAAGLLLFAAMLGWSRFGADILLNAVPGVFEHAATIAAICRLAQDTRF